MNHTERYQLALDLCARMVAKYPVIVGGVYGSTASRTDTPTSDLEMLYVVEDGCEAQGQHLVFKPPQDEHPERSGMLYDAQSYSKPAQSKDAGMDEESRLRRTLRLRKGLWRSQTTSAQSATSILSGIAVGYRVYRESELIEILANPDERWPFHVGMLEVLEVLYGDPARVREWIDRAAATPIGLFHAHLAEKLPELVIESYCRIHSSAARRDWGTARYALTEVLFEMQNALCLLNKRWVTRDYDAGLLQVAAFPKIPAGYGQLVPALLATKDFEVLLPLADRLVEGFWQLVEAEGIAVKNYQAVEEIVL